MAGDIRFTVEKGRVLVPVGMPCRFGCKYCYTRSGEVGPAKSDAEVILRQFEEFALINSFEAIQFGYDGDPFDRPERGIMMLNRLAFMGKDISFSTKAMISRDVLDALAAIHHHMALSHTTLTAFVSLSCWESAHHIEPHTPPPDERMQTISNLKRIGIPTFIALRPILPHINIAEYERLIEEGMLVGCDGFVLGPLYADDKGYFVRFISPDVLKKVTGRRGVVSWSAHAPVWTRYEDESLLRRIISLVEKKGGRAFTSSVDVITFVRERSLILDRGGTQM